MNYPQHFHHAATIILELLSSKQSSEVVLQKHFRAHPQWGKNDRKRLADAVMHGFRHLRSRVNVGDALGQWLGDVNRQSSQRVHDLKPKVNDARALAEWLSSIAPSTLSQEANHIPLWLEEMWDSQHRQDKTSRSKLMAYQHRAPLDIRVNPWRINMLTAREALVQEGFEVSELPYAPWGLRLSAKPDEVLPSLQKTTLMQKGEIAIQDVGSQWIAQALFLKGRGGIWVDYCAGAGGKTLALLARLSSGHKNHRGGRGLLLVCDRESHRSTIGTDRIHQALADIDVGVTVESIVLPNPDDKKPATPSKLSAIRTVHQRYAGRADAVLVDAPCSGLGTLRRSPDIAWRLTPERLQSLMLEQAQILRQAADWVAPQGYLLYATCSWLRAENQEVVSHFLEDRQDFIRHDLPTNLQPLISERGDLSQLEVNPWQHQSDGYYFALMQRSS